MKQKLIESAINVEFRRPVLSDSLASDGKTWSVPLWNLGKMNLNGRIYSEDLAKRLCVENKDTLCMDGHNDLFEYAAAMAHAHDPWIENGQLWVKFEFIDEEYEKKIRFCLDNGIPVGVSSVGWGDMDKDGNVNADTYELVRYFDFVSTPANETYVQESTETEDEAINNGENGKEETTAENIEEATATEDTATADNLRRLLLIRKHNSRK